MDESGFSAKLANGDILNYTFIEDEGDCCGYNEISATLLIDEKDMPAIAKVEQKNKEDEYADIVVITFFGMDKKLAEIESLSSSGSGWCYGATVTVKCVETGEEEILTSY